MSDTDVLIVPTRWRGDRAHAGAIARPAWESAYAAVLTILDALMITLAASVALAFRFGSEAASIRGLSYTLLSAALAPAWILTMALSRAYEARYLGTGSEEFKRVFNAAVRFTAVVATSAYAINLELARGYVAIALPLGTLLTLIGRYVARRFVHRQRAKGRLVHRVVAVGEASHVADLIEQMRREPHAGFLPVAACVPGGGELALSGPPLPIVGSLNDIVEGVHRSGADTVAIAGSSVLSGDVVRRLSWRLEGTGVDLVVAPAIIDIAGPRIHIRPVAGLPLLHVEEPELTGGRRILKELIDRTFGMLLLLVALPFLLLLAVAIRLDSRGPALFKQTRVGRNGEHFVLWKLRTMRLDAESRLVEVIDLNEHDGVLFKVRADPRVTRVGRWLRRHSIDELPQVLNVLNGSMSLVGPRPPLPSEVECYESEMHRRLLVKPGMTGLWQISGRSNLSWEETIRLDLYYVENWSPALDLMILWKTVFAVVRGQGAY